MRCLTANSTIEWAGSIIHVVVVPVGALAVVMESLQGGKAANEIKASE
jgi:hypothetical protein